MGSSACRLLSTHGLRQVQADVARVVGTQRGQKLEQTDVVRVADSHALSKVQRVAPVDSGAAGEHVLRGLRWLGVDKVCSISGCQAPCASNFSRTFARLSCSHNRAMMLMALFIRPPASAARACSRSRISMRMFSASPSRPWMPVPQLESKRAQYTDR